MTSLHGYGIEKGLGEGGCTPTKTIVFPFIGVHGRLKFEMDYFNASGILLSF